MSDGRRVDECTPLELLEAAIAACAAFGWASGHWRVELHVEDGRVRRAVPQLAEQRPLRATVGRRQLDRPEAA